MAVFVVQLLHAVCRNKKTFGSMIIACFTTIWICSSSWFKITAMTVERSWTECVPCWHILFMIGVFLLQCCQVSLSAGHTGSCQISRLSFEAEFGLWVQCMCWRLPQRGNFFRTTEFFFFFFLPLKWILRGHCHSVFIIGTIVMFYYLGNNNMTRCAAYKSYTFNCCWLLVDFPGVGRQSCWRIRGNKSKKQWNNEVTSQKKALYYDYIM